MINAGPINLDIPIVFNQYLDGVRYFPPLGTIIAKDAETMNALLEWMNNRPELENLGVPELIRLYNEQRVKVRIAEVPFDDDRTKQHQSPG